MIWSWWMILLSGIGGVLLLVALMAAIGALLAVKHVATRSARLAAAPDAVFAVISDFAAAPTWRREVTRVELLDATHFREHSRHGAIRFEIVEKKPGLRLVTRIDDATLPFGGSWTYVLEPDAAGTRVTITEAGEVYNVIFRFLSRFVFSHTKTLDDYLVALGRKLGETVTPA